MAAENVKIVTFVPSKYADVVRNALGSTGAGKIGEYTFCSFTSAGQGRFLPSDKANPVLGSKSQINNVNEDRVEVICARQTAKEAIAAMKEAHPYEEVAFDVYPLLSESDL